MSEKNDNLRVMIVDDDEMSSKLLSKIISDYTTDLEITGVYNEPSKAMKALKDGYPDIVFLDVDMPGISGIDLVKILPPGMEKNVIYVTGHEKFAVDALKLGVGDYLLKPITASVLVDAVDNFRSKKHVEAFELRNKLSDKLLINRHDRAVIVDINSILFLEAEGPYTHFKMVDGQSVKSSKTIGYYLKLLSDKSNLLRVNRSYVINFEHVKEIVKDDKGAGKVVFTNDNFIEFSSTVKNRLIQNIQDVLSKSVRG